MTTAPNPRALLAATRDITLWEYPVTKRGEFCDKPVDMLTTDELRTFILQMRRRYSSIADNNPVKHRVAAGHARLMAEFTTRTQ